MCGPIGEQVRISTYPKARRDIDRTTFIATWLRTRAPPLFMTTRGIVAHIEFAACAAIAGRAVHRVGIAAARRGESQLLVVGGAPLFALDSAERESVCSAPPFSALCPRREESPTWQSEAST